VQVADAADPANVPGEHVEHSVDPSTADVPATQDCGVIVASLAQM
jgi:hypothetical protein